MRTLVQLNCASLLGLLLNKGKAELKTMGLLLRILGIAAAFLIPIVSSAADKAIYYWVSHGAPADPVWTYFLQGAEQWAKDTGNDVRTSFHSGDVPSQQEAIRAAISAKARALSPAHLIQAV